MRAARFNGNGILASLSPAVKGILLANFLVYFSDLFLFDHAIRNQFSFRIDSAFYQFSLWEFFSFQFLHANVGHLLFNSMGLFFFGPFIEKYLGRKRFILFYLMCGMGGAALYSLFYFLKILPVSLPLVGASAGIYGILVAVAMIAPAMRVSLLIPPVTLTMRHLAIILLSVALAVIVLDIGSNQGGEASHLGGAIFGFLLMKYLPSDRIFSKASVHAKYKAKLKPRTLIDLDEKKDIDHILDKISEHGFQSLTDEERQSLQDAAQKANRSKL